MQLLVKIAAKNKELEKHISSALNFDNHTKVAAQEWFDNLCNFYVEPLERLKLTKPMIMKPLTCEYHPDISPNKTLHQKCHGTKHLESECSLSITFCEIIYCVESFSHSFLYR